MEKEAIFNFLVKETMFINPISAIIQNLENNQYFAKDIKFLENELRRFMRLATETLNIKFKLNLPKITMDRDISDNCLNDYVKQKYLNYFNKLLEFFKNEL